MERPAEVWKHKKAHLLRCVLAVLLAPATTFAQDGGNVLVVVNTASPASTRIAARYVRARAVPDEHVVRLTTGVDEEIERSQYERQIERPIAEWLAGRAAQDRILYIVLTKGVPLRIGGTAGRNGTLASVDSELTLLYRRLVGVRVPIVGPVENPYYLGSAALAESKPFSHAGHDVYLVSRLDGFAEPDVNGLIDRGAAPARNGSFLFDSMAPAADRVADRWLRSSADALAAAGYKGRVVLDTTPAAVRGSKGVLGYASWGSNDPSLRTRRLGVVFAPGALATLLVSTDARTLKEPPETWQPGATLDGKASFESSAQSLTADLIRDGITGAGGYVSEPFLDGTLRPDILFPAYVAGANLVESFYLATPYVSWQSVVFGDPLCAPFRARGLPPEDASPALDAETELPAHFSRRRVAYLASTGISVAAAKLLAKAESRRRRGDLAATGKALEEATALEPGLTAAQRMLAAVYSELGQHELAIERYRRVLAGAPDDVLSLNNLAYALAVHGKAPGDALPLAQQAYSASKGKVPSIADTLGWVHYLLGQHAEAEKYLGEAAAASPENADVQLHLAHVYVARGRKDLASRAISRSVQLDPKLADRPEVKALRAQLGSRP